MVADWVAGGDYGNGSESNDKIAARAIFFNDRGSIFRSMNYDRIFLFFYHSLEAMISE